MQILDLLVGVKQEWLVLVHFDLRDEFFAVFLSV